MRKENITIAGISRSADDGIERDGSCVELINMRHKDGSLEPVGRPVLLKAYTAGNDARYLHCNGGYEHIIIYSNNKIIYDSERNGENWIQKNEAICTLEGLRDVQSIGNMLIMATDNGIYYALYINNVYKYLGDAPDEPDIRIYYNNERLASSGEIWCDINPRITLNKGANIATALNETSVRLVNDSYQGNYHKLISEIHDKGEITHLMLARYALRMQDGSYIYHSAPRLLGNKDGVGISVTKISEKDGTLTDFTYKLTANVGTARISYDTSALQPWSDVIASVDIFVTHPLAVNDLAKNIDEISGYSGGNIRIDTPRKSDKDIIQEISELSSFYLVKSIPVGKSGSGENLLSDGAVFRNLEQQTALPNDGFSRNKISGQIYCYNARLHVANIRTRLTAPYSPRMVSDSDYSVADIEVHIKTDSGLKVVHTRGQIGSSISPYLSYPDTRAVRMIIYTATSHMSVDLKPHPYLNLAYSLKQLQHYELSGFIQSPYSPKAVDDIETSSNKMKVSEAQNPIFFPVAQTYTVSNRDIVTMRAATTALSTGMYSALPLYVFTLEGVWAMTVGDGIVYSTCMPVTRDCCVSADSVISTDDSIVFATETSVKILHGQSTHDISDDIEGYLPSSSDSSPIIRRIANIVKMGNALSSVEFVNYIKGCGIGYDYESQELIVSNKAYPYTYIYNIRSRNWHKTNYSVKRFINAYPRCYAVLADDGLYDLHNHHRTVNDVLVLTRPIKLGTLAHKRIVQSALRGIVRPSSSILYYKGEPVMYKGDTISMFSNAGFYILGSNDAEHFTLVAGKERIVDIRDLITKMTKSKAYKYFMLALVGGVRTDVAINYIELMIDDTYDNRLR